MDEELSRLDKSISELAGRMKAANEAAAQLRTKSASATAASARQAAYQTSLKSLTTVTASETSIGEPGFRVLDELRQRSIEQVPIQVALGEAFRTGRYSDQAFRFMLSQIDPAARDSILYGPRGGLRPRNVQFQRLTAYYGFRSGTIPSRELVSLSGMSGGRLAATRVTASVLLLAEAVNLASQAYQSYKLSQQTMRRKNLYPFIRRLLFWDRLGAHPAVVGVDDDFFNGRPTTSATMTRRSKVWRIGMRSSSRTRRNGPASAIWTSCISALSWLTRCAITMSSRRCSTARRRTRWNGRLIQRWAGPARGG